MGREYALVSIFPRVSPSDNAAILEPIEKLWEHEKGHCHELRTYEYMEEKLGEHEEGRSNKLPNSDRSNRLYLLNKMA